MKNNKTSFPHIFTLLFFATLLIVLASWIGSIYEWPVQNVLSAEGIRWILRNMDTNLYQAPLVSAFILLSGLGLAEASGLFAALRLHIRRISRHKPLSRKQKRALLLAFISTLFYIILVWIATFSPAAILLSVTGTLERSPFMAGIVSLVSLMFAIMGIVYGIASGQFHNDKDIVRGMGFLLVRMASYFLFLLMASQFMGLLHYSQIDVCMGMGETVNKILYVLLYYVPFIYFYPRKSES